MCAQRPTTREGTRGAGLHGECFEAPCKTSSCRLVQRRDRFALAPEAVSSSQRVERVAAQRAPVGHRRPPYFDPGMRLHLVEHHTRAQPRRPSADVRDQRGVHAFRRTRAQAFRDIAWKKVSIERSVHKALWSKWCERQFNASPGSGRSPFRAAIHAAKQAHESSSERIFEAGLRRRSGAEVVVPDLGQLDRRERIPFRASQQLRQRHRVADAGDEILFEVLRGAYPCHRGLKACDERRRWRAVAHASRNCQAKRRRVEASSLAATQPNALAPCSGSTALYRPRPRSRHRWQDATSGAAPRAFA